MPFFRLSRGALSARAHLSAVITRRQVHHHFRVLEGALSLYTLQHSKAVITNPFSVQYDYK